MPTAQPATSLDAVFPACAPQLAEIRRAVTEAASGLGADETVLLPINLAVSEAATNAILHAYRDRTTGRDRSVRVMVRKAGDHLDISIHDNGIGMMPRSDSPGLGLGLGLMAHEADRLEIREAPGGGTEVVLSFRLSSANQDRMGRRPRRP